MRFGSCAASVIALLAIAAPGCGKRDLQKGAGQIGIDAGGQGGFGDGALPDGVPGVSVAAATPPPDYDAGNSACVTTAIPLPWTKSRSALRLSVATAGDAVAVMMRDSEMLDVRTQARDGTVIAGFQFAADAQFLPYRDGRF